jgi:tRNA pseudouridine55 synthase
LSVAGVTVQPEQPKLRGGLLVNKPCGISSFDVIRRLKPLVSKKTKIGHAGTLDPAAQGLVIVLIGEATRVQHLIKDLDKTYVAEIKLGVATDTLDKEGAVVDRVEVSTVPRGNIVAALAGLAGERMQRPPQYSALKIKGRRAYDLARSGESFQIKERPVTIHSIELVDYSFPIIKIETRVSSGTYIRSLAAEIGEQLNLPAHLYSLIRIRIGNFSLDESLDVDNLSIETIARSMISIKNLLFHLPSGLADEVAVSRFLQGKPLEDVDERFLAQPLSVFFSTDQSQAFLCEPRGQALWSKRLIYNDRSTDA